MVRLPNAVTGPVDEILPEPGPGDHLAGDLVDLPSPYGGPPAGPGTHELEGAVPRFPDNVPDPDDLCGERLSQEGNPGVVGVDGLRGGKLGPEIDEQQVPGPDGRRGPGPWFIVRVPAVLVDGHNGRGRGLQAPFPVPLAHALLQLVLVERNAVAAGLPHLLEGLEQDFHQQTTGLEVGLELLSAPASLEVLDQIGRGNHRLAETSNQLQGAGIHPGNVGNVAMGRILHGYPCASLQQTFQTRLHLLPTAEEHGGRRQLLEPLTLNTVAKQGHGAAGRDPAEPTSGQQGILKPQQLSGNRIEALKIVKQPSIQLHGR